MRLFSIAVGLALGMGAVQAGAQTGVQVLSDEGETPTLHVYANLVQVPVLVLNGDRKPLPPIAERRFLVSVDGGRPVPPAHVRVEGDDPIELAIVLDLGGEQQRLGTLLAEAIAGLAPLELHSVDRVSVYAADCHVVRTADEVVADPDALRQAIRDAMQSPIVHGRDNTGPACGRTLHMWDVLAFATDELSPLPGRRVVLAVTRGVDHGSSHSLRETVKQAQNMGVSIFGLEDAGALGFDAEFVRICEMSGGMTLVTGRKELPGQLKSFVRLVRGRYIVEFPRSDRLTAGFHTIDVAIDKPDAFARPYFIRPAGVTVPLADPAVLADPTTVPADQTLAPQQPGDRRPLSPN